MKLVPVNGNAFIGNTLHGNIILYEWHNMWLLAKHIHYNKLHQPVIELESIDVEDNADEREVVIAGNQKSEY